MFREDVSWPKAPPPHLFIYCHNKQFAYSKEGGGFPKGVQFLPFPPCMVPYYPSKLPEALSLLTASQLLQYLVNMLKGRCN